MDDNESRYFVPVIMGAGKILKFLSRYQNRNSTLSEISQELEISKSTCFRILRTLEEMDYVAYDKDSKRYRLGSYLIVLGSRAQEQIDYLTAGREALREISKLTKFTSAIVQRISTDRLMYIAKEEGVSASAHVSISVGNQFPINRVSFGKCYLAYNKADRERILAEDLPKITEHTISNKEDYLKELERVRELGYAISGEEYIPGIKAVSAPVFNAQGEVLVVLACIGFSAFFTDDMIKEYGELLKLHANRITKLCNGRVPDADESSNSVTGFTLL